MRTRALALPIAAAVLLAGCSSAPSVPSRPAAGRLAPATTPAPGATRPPGCPSTAGPPRNLPVAPGRVLGRGAVHLLLLPGEPFSVVAAGPWAFAGLTSTVGVLHQDGAGNWSLVRTIRLPSQGGRPIGLAEALTPDGRYL